MNKNLAIIYTHRMDFKNPVALYLTSETYKDVYKYYNMNSRDWFVSSYLGFMYFNPTIYGFISCEYLELFKKLSLKYSQMCVEVFCAHMGIENLDLFEKYFYGEFSSESWELLDILGDFRIIPIGKKLYVLNSEAKKYAYCV